MPGTAFQRRREGRVGTWVEERAKTLHAKALVSRLVQTYKNQVQKSGSHYQCGSTCTPHQHRCASSTEGEVGSYFNGFHG